MKSNALLGQFITFYPAAVPAEQPGGPGDLIHTPPTTADLLSLTRFLIDVLNRVQAHELSRARKACQAELVFRITTPE